MFGVFCSLEVVGNLVAGLEILGRKCLRKTVYLNWRGKCTVRLFNKIVVEIPVEIFVEILV